MFKFTIAIFALVSLVNPINSFWFPTTAAPKKSHVYHHVQHHHKWVNPYKTTTTEDPDWTWTEATEKPEPIWYDPNWEDETTEKPPKYYNYHAHAHSKKWQVIDKPLIKRPFRTTTTTTSTTTTPAPTLAPIWWPKRPQITTTEEPTYYYDWNHRTKKSDEENNNDDSIYKFQYQVNSPETGDVKYHQEQRNGNSVHGSYSVLDPDGSARVVYYTAGEDGFKANVKKVALTESTTTENPQNEQQYDVTNLGNEQRKLIK